MKRMTWLYCILVALIAGMGTLAYAETSHEFDKASFDKIAKKTIGGILSGKVDVDAMLIDMNKLLEIGIAGCKEHMTEAETPAEEKKIMKITIDNAQKMTSLTLDQIEAQWHENGALKANGIDTEKYDHFSEVNCHYDTIVHPATALICLKQYKKTKDEDLLEQVKDELVEVREHLKHLK